MKKIKYILLLLVVLITLTGCKGGSDTKTTNDNNESKGENVNMEPNVKVIEEKDGEIVKGEIEGYTFVESEKETDRVKIQMEDGSVMLVVLSNQDSPITIKNFKSLVSQKFYDGIIFHRVIEGFMIQGGDPTGTGTGGSTNKIKGEFSSNGIKNDLKHTRGVISMARSSDPNSASSQFFIMHQDYPSLDGNYAAFGKVFAGLDEVDKIATTQTGANDKPITEQKIKSIRFIELEETK